VQVYPELRPGRADGGRKLYTPSGLAATTKIEEGRGPWLNVSSAGLAAIASGLIVFATIVVLGLA
jgi:hypothetical protein